LHDSFSASFLVSTFSRLGVECRSPLKEESRKRKGNIVVLAKELVHGMGRWNEIK